MTTTWGVGSFTIRFSWRKKRKTKTIPSSTLQNVWAWIRNQTRTPLQKVFRPLFISVHVNFAVGILLKFNKTKMKPWKRGLGFKPSLASCFQHILGPIKKTWGMSTLQPRPLPTWHTADLHHPRPLPNVRPTRNPLCCANVERRSRQIATVQQETADLMSSVG